MMSDPFDALRDHMDDRFESVNQRIEDKHEEGQRQTDAIRDELKEFRAEMRQVLNGNGQPGLVRLVDRHEQKINELTDGDTAVARKHGSIWGAVSGLITAITAGVLIALGRGNG